MQFARARKKEGGAPPGRGLSRRFVCAFMSVVLAVGLMPLPAFADLQAAGVKTAAVTTITFYDGTAKVSKPYEITNLKTSLPAYAQVIGTDGTTKWGAAPTGTSGVGWVLSSDFESGFYSNAVTGTTYESLGLVEGGTYTFYAAKWATATKTLAFHTRTSVTAGTVGYRVEATSNTGTTQNGVVLRSAAESGNGSWNMLGVRTEDDPTVKDWAAVTSGSDTTYYEVATRDLNVVLGNSSHGDGAVSTVSFTQSYDASKASPYGLDTSNFPSDLSTYVPENSGWTFAGFKSIADADPLGANDRVVEPTYDSVSGLEGGVGEDAALTADAVNAPMILTVYKRDLTLKKYEDQTKYNTAAAAGFADSADGNCLKETATQYYCMPKSGNISPTEAATNSAFTVSDLSQYHWYNSTGVELTDLDASHLGFGVTWGSTPTTTPATVVGVYNSTTNKFPTEDFTVEYWDRNSSGELVKMDSVNEAVGGNVTLTTGPSAMVGDKSATRSGWSVDHWVDKTGATISKVSSSSVEAIEVYPVWTRTLSLKSGNNPASATDVTQTWDVKDDSTPTAGGGTTIPTTIDDWTFGKWATSATATSGTVDAVSTYTGSSTALFATYSRTATLNYTATTVTGARPDSPSGWKASDTATQTYNSGSADPSSITFNPPTLSATGWTFNGWTESDGTGTPSKAAVTIPGTAAPVGTPLSAYTRYDNWTKQTVPVSYTVEHQQMGLDGTTYTRVGSVETKSASEGTAITGSDLKETYEGFTYASSDPPNATLAEGTPTAFVLKYSRNTHAVTKPGDVSKNGNTVSFDVSFVGAGSTSTEAAAYYGDTVKITPTGLPAGYTVSYESTPATTTVADDGTFTMPDSAVTLTATVEAPKADYKVEHYQMGLDGKYPAEPTAVDELNDEVDKNVAATPEAYEGFIHDAGAEGTVASGTIVADGSLVLKLYYERNKYAVTKTFEVADPSDPSTTYAFTVTPSSDAAGDGYAFFGDTVAITHDALPENLVPVYSDSGTAHVKVALDGTFTMPAADVSLSAVLKPAVEFTVEHHQQQLDGTYAKFETETGKYAAGEECTALPKEYAGFAVNETKAAEATGTVLADGSLVLKRYYDRETYDCPAPAASNGVTFTAAGASALSAPAPKVAFGDTVTITPSKTSGYTITYAVKDAAGNAVPVTVGADGKGTFTMPASAVTITATATPASTPTPAPKPLSPSENKEQNKAKALADLNALVAKGDKDAKDPFNLLQARMTKATKNSMTIKWTPAASVKAKAKSYVVYGSMCGKKYKYRLLGDFTTTSKKFSKKLAFKDGAKPASQKLKAATSYKFVVMAFDAEGNLLATSKTVHAFTPGGKKGNVKKVTVKNKTNLKITMKVKKSKKLTAKVVKQAGKKLVQHRKVIFESANPDVVKVTQKPGKKATLKALKKGKAVLYAYGCDGKFAKVTVTVK